jgi:hypothetical protein
MKKVVSLIALAGAAVFSGNVLAQQVNSGAGPSTSIKPYIGIGYTAGGDKLASALYDDGNTVNIRAGNGFQLNGGLEFLLSSSVSATATVGYHLDRASADNGSLKFERIPVELVGHYHLGSGWRLGAGVRFVSGATLSGSGVTNIPDVDFDATTGAVLQVEYVFNPSVSVLIRGVSEKYKVNGLGSSDGTHIGVMMNAYFF